MRHIHRPQRRPHRPVVPRWPEDTLRQYNTCTAPYHAAYTEPVSHLAAKEYIVNGRKVLDRRLVDNISRGGTMKLRNLLLAGIAGMAIASLAAAAQSPAQESGFYVGISTGRSKVDVDTAGIDAAIRAAGIATSSTTVDDNDTGWRFGVGYQFNRYLAAEVSFTDLGQFSSNTVTTGPAARVTGRIEAETLSFDLVGTLPLGTIDLLGRIGVHRWDADARLAGGVGAAVTTVSTSDNGTDWKYGVGARWNINRNFGLELQFERYKDIGNDSTTGKGDVDFLSLGVRWKF
jgi:OmpA-OmpF porin, OOP family